MMIAKKGLFLVLEGGEGVGKSTNSTYIKQLLDEQGISYTSTREPGGTELAEKIRELILHKHEELVDPLAELLLVFAARAQHLARKILPSLNSGAWVLSDRFTDATYAYQGGGRSLDKQAILSLENFVQGELRPDCVIILDAPVELGRARAEARAELDRMESEEISFHQRVRDAYLERAKADPDKYAVIDASQPLCDVQRDIKQVIQTLIDNWKSDE